MRISEVPWCFHLIQPVLVTAHCTDLPESQITSWPDSPEVSPVPWPDLPPDLSYNCPAQTWILCLRLCTRCITISYQSFLLQSLPLTLPHPSPRHPHSKILFIPYTSTYAHKFSFYVDVIPLWNSLPLYVVNSPSASSFKYYRISKHYSTVYPFFIFIYSLYFSIFSINPLLHVSSKCIFRSFFSWIRLIN